MNALNWLLLAMLAFFSFFAALVHGLLEHQTSPFFFLAKFVFSLA